MKKILAAGIIALFTNPLLAFDQTHDLFTQVMKKFNEGGLIKYAALKADSSLLDEYLKNLNSVSETEFKSWTDEQKIAFYTNAYNAYTLKAIITNYPIKSSFLKSRLYPKNSIRQIDGVWDKLTWPLLGKKLTLNQIEHEILRKEFKEPRIHMALVCAAISCPPLRGEAYTGEKLNEQFDDQSKTFLTSAAGFKLESNKKTVSVSKIFKWFEEDFGKDESAVLSFVKSYIPANQKETLQSASFDLDYLDYDWSLNEKK